jgi:hypothetical protein
MTRDDHAVFARRVEVELGEIVQHVNADAADLQLGTLRHGSRPAVAIVVAAHRGERRDLAQRVEDQRIADVAGVDDVRRAAQEAQRLGSKQTVRVGD